MPCTSSSYGNSKVEQTPSQPVVTHYQLIQTGPSDGKDGHVVPQVTSGSIPGDHIGDHMTMPVTMSPMTVPVTMLYQPTTSAYPVAP